MTLAELIHGLDVHVLGAVSLEVPVVDVTEDSRRVRPGTLFVARAGRAADGKAFVAEALAGGAVAVLADNPVALPPGIRAPILLARDPLPTAARLAERLFGYPSRRLRLMGITGTNGKTTTAHLVHHICNATGRRCGLMGTVMTDDGRTRSRATLTTPPPDVISRTLRQMLDAGCTAAVMEVSSHALDQGRVAALHFAAGVFTNLTGDHLDYHGTMEAYAAAKARLFAMLPPDGLAVIAAGDPYAGRMADASRAPITWCRLSDEPVGPDGSGRLPGPRDQTCSATILDVTTRCMHVRLAGPWGQFDVPLRLIGRHNAMNVLQAVAVCHALGVSAAELAAVLPRAQAPPGRLEFATAPDDPVTVLIDYAHTDDALRRVLTAVRQVLSPGGRLRVVFGCGGDRDRAKRPRMGAVAADLADCLYVTSDNPRSEHPQAIIAEILAGIPPAARARTVVEPDRRRAIRLAIHAAAPGDIVLIAGKGHETEQIVSDGCGNLVRHHFDDLEEARAAWAARTRSIPASA